MGGRAAGGVRGKVGVAAGAGIRKRSWCLGPFRISGKSGSNWRKNVCFDRGAG